MKGSTELSEIEYELKEIMDQVGMLATEKKSNDKYYIPTNRKMCMVCLKDVPMTEECCGGEYLQLYVKVI